jgi:hypothetical protein
MGTNGSNMGAVDIPQHLHAMITVIGYKNMARIVKDARMVGE